MLTFHDLDRLAQRVGVPVVAVLLLAAANMRKAFWAMELSAAAALVMVFGRRVVARLVACTLLNRAGAGRGVLFAFLMRHLGWGTQRGAIARDVCRRFQWGATGIGSYHC